MANANTPPPQGGITASANVVGNLTLSSFSHAVTVTNRTGVGEVWVTLDGSTPQAGGAGVNANPAYLIPAAICSVVLPVFQPPGAEAGGGTIPVKAFSTAALSVWVQAN